MRLAPLFGLACLFLLAACGGTAPSQRPTPVADGETTDPAADAIDEREPWQPGFLPVEETIPVAVLLPLNGPGNDLGQALLNAVTIAFFEANDPRLTLRVFDTLGSPGGTERAMTEALAIDPAIIIGPLFSDSIQAATPLAQAAGIPLLGFSNDRQAADRGAYLISFLPETEVRQVVAYAARHGSRRFAALIPEGDYGDRVLDALGPAVNTVGASLTGMETYAPVTEEMFDPVRRLSDYDQRRRAYDAEVAALQDLGGDMANQLLEKLEPLETLGSVDFDAILIPEGGSVLRSLAPLLPYHDVDPKTVRFLGTGLWDDPGLTTEPSLIGGWFAAPDPAPVAEFSRRYRDLFGTTAPRLATLGHDAMALVAQLARNPIPDNRFSEAALTDPAGFVGIDGPFRLLPSGLVDRNFAIIEVRETGMTVIQPAASGFRLEDRLGRLRSAAGAGSR